jgi:hypothetical protein
MITNKIRHRGSNRGATGATGVVTSVHPGHTPLGTPAVKCFVFNLTPATPTHLHGPCLPQQTHTKGGSL